MSHIWHLRICCWSKIKSLLHHLPSLHCLEISHCMNLTYFPSTSTHPFPALGKLCLRHVRGTFLESALKNLSSFTSIGIEAVAEFTSLPKEILLNNRNLWKIKLKNCPRFQGSLHHHENGLQLLTSLRKLRIEDCHCVTSLDFMKNLEALPSLSMLKVGGFLEELDYFPFPIHSRCLVQHLMIKGWFKLEQLPEELQHLTTLVTSTITNFDSLTAWPAWIGNLSSLELLKIDHCKNLMHLPSKQDMQRLTDLLYLVIEDCPQLLERFMAGAEEWCKTANDGLMQLKFDSN